MPQSTQPRPERETASRGRTYETITDACGGTPLVRLRRVVGGDAATVYAKCEFLNPMGSVKDRVALAMIEAAERAGLVDRTTHIIEATSGDMGVALAWVCAARGYRLTITMPESANPHRIGVLQKMGAAVVLTPDAEGMPGALARAGELVADEPSAWMPCQFDNPANPATHERTTGPEIWSDTAGRVDVFVAGVGTGGTITGVGRHLKGRNPALRVVAVEPQRCAVIAGREPSPHRIPGLGAGFVPAVCDAALIDAVETVTDEEACHWSRRLAAEEGLRVGVSSGAAACAAARLAERSENRDKVIVTVLPCGGRFDV